jgi:hypothetical protein
MPQLFSILLSTLLLYLLPVFFIVQYPLLCCLSYALYHGINPLVFVSIVLYPSINTSLLSFILFETLFCLSTLPL